MSDNADFHIDPSRPDSEFVTWNYQHAAVYDPAADAILIVGGSTGFAQTHILRLVAGEGE